MAKCKHVNRHSYGIDGKLDNLECVLEEGHDGLHEAPHYEVATQLSGTLDEEDTSTFNVVTDKNGNVYYEGTVTRRWSDAAGVPAKDIKPESPGVHLVQAYDMFPEQQKQEFEHMKQELAELKAALLEQSKPAAKAKAK